MSFLSGWDSGYGFWEKIETVSHPFPVLSPGAMVKSNSLRTDLMILRTMENSCHENQKHRKKLGLCPSALVKSHTSVNLIQT